MLVVTPPEGADAYPTHTQSSKSSDKGTSSAAFPGPGNTRRGPGREVIRRRPRKTRVINCPPPVEHRSSPSPLDHARLFVLAFAVLLLLGSVLLLTPWATQSGQTTNVYDALFTAVSAAAVTGLVTVNTSTHWSFFGQVIILSLIQLGGLGFMVGTSLVLALLRRGGSLRSTMLMRDSSPTLTLREAADFSGRIVRFTVVVEAVGAALLTLYFWLRVGMTFPHALWHGLFLSVAAFCNAGFDLSPNFQSLIPYDDAVIPNVVIALLIQAGALSYIVFHDLWTHRSWERLALDTKLILSVNGVLVVGGALIFAATEWSASLANMPLWARPMGAVFQSIAARTAGFTTVNFGQAVTVTLLIWLGLMAIGGAAGSTAGGVHLTTVGVVGTAVVSALRGHSEIEIFGRRINPALVFRSMAVIALYLVFYLLVTVSLVISEAALLGDRFSVAALMFEAMSALATVGLSAGMTPELSDAGKVILALAMFMGRVGPLTVAYALQGHQRSLRYRFTEEPIRLG